MPSTATFVFKMTLEATEKIFLVLKSFNFKVEWALEAQAESPMGYGSELKKDEILLPLHQNNPLWPCLKKLREFESQWPTAPIPKEERMPLCAKPWVLVIIKVPRPSQNSFSNWSKGHHSWIRPLPSPQQDHATSRWIVFLGNPTYLEKIPVGSQKKT